jgi:methyl-accepting chemotaxis protein
MNIKKKLIMGFLVIVLLSSAVSGFALFHISGMKKNAQEIDDKWIPNLATMGWINMYISDVARINYAITLEPDTIAKSKMVREQSETLQELDQKLKDYEKEIISGSEEQKLYDVFKKEWGLYLVKVPAILEAANANNLTLANQRITESNTHWTKANDLIEQITDMDNKSGHRVSEYSQSDAESAFLWVSILTLSIAILATFIGWFIARMIANPLKEMVSKVQEVANGNFAINEVEIKSKDEVGLLGIALNAMTNNLRVLIKQVAESAEQVATSAEELTTTAEQSAQVTSQIAISISEIATGTEQQVTAIDETSSTVQQMSAGIQQIAASANTVMVSADKTAKASYDGGKKITTAVKQMNTIEETVSHSAGVITKLGQRSNEIGEIVATISGIAGQTNLLALNAAIEAARAGEQGRGFAVVAEEVRKLAEQSQDAAKKIAELISEVQRDTKNAVLAMDEGNNEVRVGTEVVTAAGQAFSEIETLISQVSEQVKEISEAIQQMATGSQQIVSSMSEIDRIGKDAASQTQNVSAATEEQSASVEEIAASSETLANMAQDLQNSVSKFKV